MDVYQDRFRIILAERSALSDSDGFPVEGVSNETSG
jgi:hypothetical protein